jgi:hypothetical protein
MNGMRPIQVYSNVSGQFFHILDFLAFISNFMYVDLMTWMQCNHMEDAFSSMNVMRPIQVYSNTVHGCG